MAPGQIELSIGFDSMKSQEGSINYYYYRSPTIQEVVPSTGPLEVTTTVTISGSHFHFSNQLKCKFDGAEIEATWISDSLLKCRSLPSDRPGVVPIQVSFNGYDYLMTDISFYLFEALNLERLIPSIGVEGVESKITIVGYAFTSSLALSCKFTQNSNTVYCKAAVMTFSLCICKLPSSSPGMMDVELSSNFADFVSDSLVFEVLQFLEIQTVEPTVVASEGGSSITIFGRNYDNNISCCIFDALHERANLVSSGVVTCAVPATVPGSIPVSLSYNCKDVASSPYNIQAIYSPRITILQPTLGPVQGGTLISISGTNVHPLSSCCFESICNPITFFTSTFVNCLSVPASPGILQVFVNISNVQSNSLLFVEFIEPELLSIVPTSGFASNVLHVTLIGIDFKESLISVCKVGCCTSLVAKTLSSSHAICSVPPLSSGEYSIEYSYDGTHFTQNGFLFTILKAPFLLSIEPSFSFVSQSVKVTMHGINFVSQALSCDFGQSNILKSHFLTSSKLLCLSPIVQVPQSTSVGLLIYNTSSVHGQVNFEFICKNAQISLTLTGASRIVSVVGQNFEKDRVFCKFDDLETQSEYISSKLILCKRPQILYGDVSVSVRALGTCLEAQFLPLVGPQIVSIMPSVSPVSGLNNITVTGLRFHSENSRLCVFGKLSSPAEVITSSLVFCFAPANSRGLYDFALHDRSYVSSNKVSILYTDLEEIWDIQPSVALVSGGSLITLLGATFPIYSCHFENQALNASFLDGKNSVVCTSPPSKLKGAISLVVTAGKGLREKTFQFWYLSPVELSLVNPLSSPVQGGQLLSIYGDFSLTLKEEIRCVIDYTKVVAEQISSSCILCITPYHAPGLVNVEIHQHDISIAVFFLRYYEPFEVYDFSPKIGTIHGGSSIIIQGIFDSAECYCLFGAGPIIQCSSVEKAIAECVTPPTSVQNITIRISPDRVSWTVVGNFEFMDLEQNILIFPSLGYCNGNSMLQIQSSSPFQNFLDLSILCSFPKFSILEKGDIKSHSVATCRLPGPFVGLQNFQIISEKFNLSRTISCLPFPIVTNIQPSTGAVSGMTKIYLHGKNFLNGMSCRFGKLGTVNATLVNNVTITCISPPSLISTIVFVQVEHTLLYEYHTPSEPSVTFSYEPQAWLEYAVPQFISVSHRSTAVTMVGRFFVARDDLSCILKNKERIHARYISSSVAICLISSLQEESLNIQISNNGVDTSDSLVLYFFSNQSNKLTIKPSQGSTEGGTDIEVSFRFALNNSVQLYCMIDQVMLPLKWGLDGTAICKSPPHSSTGQVELKIVEDAGNIFMSSPFEYLRAPRIGRIVPNIVSVRGGQMITVYGQYFLPQLLCRIGNFSQVSNFLTSTKIACKTPSASRPGPSKLYLLLENDSNIFADSLFEYERDASIFQVKTSSNSVGLMVSTFIIIGKHFKDVDNLNCVLGANIRSQALLLSSSLILCQNDQIARPNMIIVSLEGIPVDPKFQWRSMTINQKRSLTPVGPLSGPVSGGTKVEFRLNTLKGEETFVCLFGDQNSFANVILPSTLFCKSPKYHSASYVPLQVYSTADNNVFERMTFEYYPEPIVHYLLPSFGPRYGRLQITVIGENFRPKFSCSFGKSISLKQHFFQSSSSVVCFLDSANSDSFAVEISLNGHDFTQNDNCFASMDSFRLNSISDFRDSDGFEHVVIVGENFVKNNDIECVFGNNLFVTAEVKSYSLVKCTMPELPNGNFSVAVSFKRVILTTDILRYESISKNINISMYLPSLGPINGGTRIHFHLTGGQCPGNMHLKFISKQIECECVKQYVAECLAPPSHHAGIVDITLFAKTSKFSIPNGFEYYEEPKIQTVMPSFGMGNALQKITLFGVGFRGSNISVRVGNFVLKDENVNHITSTVLECGISIVNHGIPRFEVDGFEDYPIQISLNGGSDFSTEFMSFRLLSFPKINSVSPQSVEAFGDSYSTSITLNGENFVHGVPYSCVFRNKIRSPGLLVGSNAISCKIPRGLNGILSVGLAIAKDQISLHKFRIKILRIRPFDLCSISPSFGPISGGTVVSLIASGKQFSSSQFRIRLGNTIVSSTANFSFATPAVRSPGRVQMEFRKSTV
eukprot:766251-Hanusia_phi.AAC.2